MSTENAVRSCGAVPALVRGILLVALVAAAAATLVSSAAAAAGLVGDLARGVTTVSLVTEAALPGSAVHGHLVQGSYATASVSVRRLPDGVIALIALAGIGGLLARLALGVALVLLLAAVLRRAPFASALALPLTVAGAAAMLMAVVSIGCGVLRDWMLADLLTATGSGSWPTASILDPTLVALGFAVMVVGLLAEHGSRLQRETEGLV